MRIDAGVREDRAVTSGSTADSGSGLDAQIRAEVEKLDPKLRPYVGPTVIGLALRHPLVFQVPVLSAQIANDVLTAKQTRLVEAYAERNYSLVLQLHERGYRLDALDAIRQGTSLDDLSVAEFSRLAHKVWIDSESVGRDQDRWLVLFDHHIDTEAFMRPEDAATLAALPTDADGCIQIHRGCDPDSLRGMSWTTSYDKAQDFAYRLRDEPILLTGRVHKDDVLAYTDARSEAEIIVRPDTVSDIETTGL